jgi:hypothetical protein
MAKECLMPPSRRAFLKIAGSSAVILAAGGGGLGAFALTRAPERALAPWRLAGSGYADPRMRALSYAILAPNPHNRQPWIVDLGQPGAAVLTCDPDRRLPETDPYDRQIAIGLGCFLELARLAAAAQGFELGIEPFPQGEGGPHLDGRPVARMTFTPRPEMAIDPLFLWVPQRRSNKQPFDTAKAVAPATLEALLGVAGPGLRAGGTLDPAAVSRFRDLSWRAHLLEMETPRTNRESVELMRIGKAEIEARPDGIDLGGAFLEGLSLLGMLSREQLLDTSSTAYRQGLDIYREMLGTAMGHVWIATPGNRRIDQLNAGRAWLRMNLKATELGLGVHPLSQALQEYPEMAALFEEMTAVTGTTTGERLQMFARIGYGAANPPAPRWRLETRIKRT